MSEDPADRAEPPGAGPLDVETDDDGVRFAVDGPEPAGAEPPGAEPMIRLHDVHKHYRLRDGREVRALDGLTLDVPAGSVHGVVGTSGAGKSTLVRCLTALERPTSGEVRVAGQDLTALGARELRGYLRSSILQNVT